MNIQATKLQFIGEYVKLKNIDIIEKLSAFLNKEKSNQKSKRSVLDFVGIINRSEAAAMKKVINEGCENIDNNEW